MTPDQWQRVKDVLATVLELAPDKRSAYLDRKCGSDVVLREQVEDLLDGAAIESVSARFHLGVARLISSIACKAREEHRLNRVALSGGVFQNMLLLEQTCRMLRADGFEVFTHHRVPPNDGGISLGQAAIANARLRAGRIH